MKKSMKFVLTAYPGVNTRGELIAALKDVLRSLEVSGNWHGLATVDGKNIAQWEVK